MEKNKDPQVIMGRYRLGRLLGRGSFAKVYKAHDVSTGEAVAIKVFDKEAVRRSGTMEQVKREVDVMRRIRHPNVVRLHEVMATRSRIYFVMDRGVYHRDLKPENLLLDAHGNLKVSDFGLSALSDGASRLRGDGLLHTTCGTPTYVAPEVIQKRGYDDAKADIWSCGVVLFVLLAGHLPFKDTNLVLLYQKIARSDYKCPAWFSVDARKILARLLDPVRVY
ncbi:hypothetical protein ACQ4PT_023419 [Festuca glaucescens]